VHGEEAAAPQSQRIAPLQDCDIAGLVNQLGDAGHLGRSELAPEHLADRRPALDWGLGNLVVDGVVVVERCESVGVTGVEELDP
jgi:hypothetical protein